MEPFVPPQVVGLTDVEVMAGLGLTVTVLVAVFWHPVANAAVTVYVVFAVGDAITVAPVEDDSAVAGLQV
jgi:hypothetical protein